LGKEDKFPHCLAEKARGILGGEHGGGRKKDCIWKEVSLKLVEGGQEKKGDKGD